MKFRHRDHKKLQKVNVNKIGLIMISMLLNQKCVCMVCAHCDELNCNEIEREQ